MSARFMVGVIALALLSVGCGDYWDWLFPEDEICEDVYDPCVDEWVEICHPANARIAPIAPGSVDCAGPGPCGCPDVWEPVCDAEGTVYGNRCEARCNGVTRVRPCEGDSSPPSRGGDCVCPELWDPVCDEAGTRYSNRCEARCAGAGDTTPCPEEEEG